jgi:predicted CoA-binding protein
MARTPALIDDFLSARRIAVAGASRSGKATGNFILKKLRDSGYEAIPVNPAGTPVDGFQSYANLASIPGTVDGLVVATHPRHAAELVRQCADRGIRRVWFHRSFGEGSVSEEAVREGRARGLACIVGGCPLMYCGPVDPFHACFRWWLERRGRIEG